MTRETSHVICSKSAAANRETSHAVCSKSTAVPADRPNAVIVAQMPRIATETATGAKEVATAERKATAATTGIAVTTEIGGTIAAVEERTRDALLLNRGVTGPDGE